MAVAPTLSRILQHERLTDEQEDQLSARIQAGDSTAATELAAANMKLVSKIARSFISPNVSLDDLMMEGYEALLEATKKFDPAIGRFGVWASIHIRDRMKQFQRDFKFGAVRLPEHVVRELGEIGRARHRLSQKLGRDASDAETAQHLSVPVWRVEVSRGASMQVSFDQPLSGENSEMAKAEYFLHEVVTAETCTPLFDHESIELVREVMLSLSPRRREIIEMRYGLNGDDPKTLEEVGLHYGVSRERVRQIQLAAEKQLRFRCRQHEARKEINA